jgi:hypothetical protein
MAKRKVRNQIANLTLDHLKLQIALISLQTGSVPDTVEKFSTKATTLIENSFQSQVFTQSYGPPKLRESQFWEFWDSHLEITGQNDIWVLALWPSTNNTIRGKVVASPKFGPWWVLWIRIYMWLVRATKVV